MKNIYNPIFGLFFMLATSLTCLHADCCFKFEGNPEHQKYKPHALDIIAQYLPEDPIIFEAGAHYGTDTIKFLEKWPNSEIYAFEPNPHAYSLLEENTKNFPNIYPQNIAITDSNGTITLNVCHGTTGNDPTYESASSVLEANDYMKIHYQGPKVQVPCAILDDWCKEKHISGFDFMWVDMEGYEMQALLASPKILSTVKVIYIETNFQEFRIGMTQYKDLKPFLESHGFRMVAHWYLEGLQGDAIFVREPIALVKYP